MQLKIVLQNAVASGLDRIDADLLLLHCLERTEQGRAWLIAHDTDALSPEQINAYELLCMRRLAGEPVAYITGWRGFYGLELEVSPVVLDPRPDTETLVEWALDVLQYIERPTVLDMGTGSGAVAVAIQSQRPDASVWALDKSAAALQVAQRNAQRLKLPVRCVQSDWFQAVPAEQRFDCIVSNPPYVADDAPELSALHHEPYQALVAQQQGYADLFALIEQAPTYLQPEGWLLLEHGWQQHEQVRAHLQQYGYQALDCREDLQGHVRCTGGRL